MKTLNIYGIALLSMLAFSACDKELSTPPPNAKVNGTAIIDQKTAQIVLNGVYYRFANASSTQISWTSQNVAPGMLTGMLAYAFGGAYQIESNINLNAMLIPSIWTNNYQLLAQANGFIEGVTALGDHDFATPGRKAEMLAEARYVRAHAHFKLLLYFSEWKDLGSKNGVLLRTELGGLSTVIKSRNTVAESYDAILSDLDYAVANGPENNPNYFVNKYAAMALEARVLLTRGQPADITKALALTNMVIGSNKYQLEPNLKDIFYSKGLASKEVILGLRPQINQEMNREIQSNNFRLTASSGFAAKKAFRTLLSGDPRQTWMIGVKTNRVGHPDDEYFTKYGAWPAASATQLSETQYAIRLSEVYLMRAEALARSGGSLIDAKADIKLVMAKAGVTIFALVDAASTSEEVWIQAYYETLRNLSTEDGIDWNALVRFPLATITSLRPTITSVNQLWFGVPVAEFQTNPMFGSQNAGGYPVQ
ncbi:hypothetical protein ABIE26_004214 [Pedobacter africanus]|uniref:Uncharacterized protein n=1 Tax=Pedobacter africanus TaxID=151894 RepID=A0ACC6L2B9_9SPHI|nr:RagB/SusD family nutrient uptake outer membrane protein [Pedobacter africanus]MDR6785504.1 hypothetical protein [Pedobacter africanus]